MIAYDPLPQKQILSYQVRGPEVEAISHVMRWQMIVPIVSLVEKFVPPEEQAQVRKADLLREALNFLRLVEFVRQVTDEEQNITLHWADDFTDREPFSLQLLRRLQSFKDDRRAFRLVTDLVAHQNLLLAHRRDVVTALEVAYPGSYSWNAEKVQTWLHLSDYLGLVRSMKPDQGDILFCPQPTLLLDLLAAYQSESGITGKIPIGEWISFVHETYFSCFTDRQEIHTGLARSLKALDAADQLKFDMRSDAPGAVSLDGQRVAYLTPPEATAAKEAV